MRANSELLFTNITVPTKDLDSIGEVVIYDPFVDLVRALPNHFPVFFAIVVYMVNGEKVVFGYATTLAPLPITTKDYKLSFKVLSLLAGQLFLHLAIDL